MSDYDQNELITCPHCKKQLELGLDFEFDYDEDGASASAVVSVLEVEKNG